MSEISKQIEDMANQMEKSTMSGKERLFSVIKSLGPEGLKEKMSILTEDEKIVLKAVLEEMTLTKAISFDKEAQSAKPIQGKVDQTIIQEEIASDDADEKLMKPEAAAQNHQGTPTEGWEGQVIKASSDQETNVSEGKNMKKSDIESHLEEIVEKAMDKCNDDKMVMKKLKEKGMEEGKVQGALDKYKMKKNMKKSEDLEKGKMKEKVMDKDEAKEKIMSMEEKEHGTKDPKKLVEAEKKEKKEMKKSDEDVEKAKKMNKEEDQLGDAPEMNEKTMGKKESAPDIEDNAKASKNAQKDVKNLKVKKSVSWEEENRLFKSNSLGRNHSFNLEQFVNETLKAADQPQTEIKKSEVKEDLNDIIEKSMDRNWDQVNHERRMKEQQTSGRLVKSFDEISDLAASMGISEEEAKKILGE